MQYRQVLAFTEERDLLQATSYQQTLLLQTRHSKSTIRITINYYVNKLKIGLILQLGF